MLKLLRLSSAAFLVSMLSLAPAEAQRSTTRGFTLGLDLGASGIAFEGNDADSGGNVGLRVGYGVNRIVTLYAAFQGANLDIDNFTQFQKVTVGHVDLGVRLHIASSRRRWVPYGDVALTPRVVSADVVNNDEVNTVDFSGSSLTLGGGLAVYLAEAWALDVNVKWSGGEFTEVDLGSVVLENLDIDATSGRITLGVTWWP